MEEQIINDITSNVALQEAFTVVLRSLEMMIISDNNLYFRVA